MSKKVNEIINIIKTNYKKTKDLTVDELVKVLKKLSNVYYNTGESLVPDVIYDELRDLLKKKNPDHPFLDEVGAPVKGNKILVKLPYEMGSLNKYKPGTGEIDKWQKKYKGPYIISDKLDGGSVQLYKNDVGEVFLFSRGKSISGWNISHLIPYVVPKNAVDVMPNNTSIRGELIISKKDFEKISSYRKNIRNAVGGLINSHKSVDIKVAKISKMVCYSILYPKYLQDKQFKLLEKWGFENVEYKKVNDIDDDMMKKYLTKRKKDSNYEIDGIVCVDNSNVYEQSGGYPDHMFAFKMLLEDQIEIAIVEEIIWSASMDGYLKPKIRIKPVELSGSTVTYATAFNAKFIVDNVLGKGAEIKIVKSGEVIPYILEVTKPAKSGKPDLPKEKYEWNETKVDIIMKDVDESTDVTIKLLTYFFSIMGIKYLSEGIITKLVDEGYDTIFKILKADKNELSDINGLGEKMIDKIFKEIDRAFDEVDLQTFMAASHKFGRGLAVKKLEEVINMYPDIMLVKWKKDKLIEKIQKVNGFSEKLSTLFAENFNDFKDFYKKIAKIKDITRFEEIEDTDSDIESDEEKLLDDMIIVMTGFRDKELETKIKSNGGKVVGSVSKNTTILIHKDGAETNSAKFKKAAELGVDIISKSEFMKKYKF
jgi:DNA ligase (NAD+)